MSFRQTPLYPFCVQTYLCPSCAMSVKNLGDRIINAKEQIDNKIQLINTYMSEGEHFIDVSGLQNQIISFHQIDFDSFMMRCENTKRIIEEVASAASLERKRRTLESQFNIKRQTVNLKRKFDGERREEFIGQVTKQQRVSLQLIPSTSAQLSLEPPNTETQK